MGRDTLASKIAKFAERNKLQLHPGLTPAKWADLLLMKGTDACPCVPGRKHCPCKQALKDIAELNRCRCGLFCNEAYIEEYNRLRGEGRSVRRWNQKPEGSS